MGKNRNGTGRRFLKAGLALLLCACAAPGAVFAKEKAPKVSVLLETANNLMSQAETTYVDGNAKEAIELYRKALAEIDRLERENPVRAADSEFAPVRFRRALCETSIDRIMLEEMSATARTVAVTDTSALEAKRAARKKEAETNNMPEATVALTAKGTSGGNNTDTDSADAATRADAETPVNARDELEWAKDMLSVDRFDDAEKALVKILRNAPENADALLLMALARIQQGKHSDAQVVLDDILQDAPDDEAALLLAAGSHAASGNYSRAMDALDKVLKIDPSRPDGYHDMAWLLLEMNPRKLDEPEMYYRQAVKLGGPRDRDLERRLGIRQE